MNLYLRVPSFFCFDVCKLYPSVPKEEGIAACREALETRTAPLIPTEYCTGNDQDSLRE